MKKVPYQEIKTEEDAFAARGIDITKMPDVSMLSPEHGEYLLNIYKDIVVNEALNEGWKPTAGDHNEGKYFPVHYVKKGYVPGSGGGFSFYRFRYDHVYSRVGARHTFKDGARARYKAEQFPELCEKVQLIIE